MLGFIITLFIAIGLIAIGLKYFVKLLFFKKKFSMVIASVVSLKTVIDEASFIKYPIIKYMVNGEEIIEKIDYGMTVYNWKEGDKIRIFYNPKRPKNFVIDDLKIKLISSVMIVVGLVFIILGGYFSYYV